MENLTQPGEQNRQQLLLQMLEANKRKMESISSDLVKKSEELNRLNAEIEELNRLNPGGKRAG